jgi:thiol-disulfide isomerase/thioredoxin
MRCFSLPSWTIPAVLLAMGMAGLLSSRPGLRSVPVIAVAKRREAATMTVTTLRGEPWRLVDKRGRVVVINYFASWCGPCRAEAPDLVTLHKQFAGQSVEFVGVSYNENPAPVAGFVREFGVKFPVAALAIVPRFTSDRGMAVPTTVLVDKQGRIAAHIGGRVDKTSLETAIERLRAE